MSTATSLTLYRTRSFRAKVTYQQFIGIASPDRTGEITGIKDKDTCSPDINYDKCVYKTKEDIMRRATRQNCTVPFTPNNENVCNESDDMAIAFYTVTKALEKHHCSVPCKSLFINFGGKTMNMPNEKKTNRARKNRSKKGKKKNSNKKKNGKKKKNGRKSNRPEIGGRYNAKLYFGTRVQKIEEHQLYKFINLIAESGSTYELPKLYKWPSSRNKYDKIHLLEI